MSRAELLDWLRIWEGCPGLLPVFTLPDRRSEFFPADHPDLPAYITNRAADQNVYIGCCPVGSRPDSGRGGAGDTVALPGVWADLDIRGDGHKDKTLPLPADEDAAQNVISAVGIEPTMVLHSGGGFQVWWVFEEPWVCTGGDDRAAAGRLVRQFGETIVRQGRQLGVHVDQVGDLARILRPAGTINHKGGHAKPVRLIKPDGPLWTVSEVASVLDPEPERQAAPCRPPTSRRKLTGHDGPSPIEAFNRYIAWPAILEPAGFHLTSEHGGVSHWRHPAASSPAGIPSATTGAHGTPVLVVHSESAAAATGLPAGSGHRLTRFRTWAILNHGGDESAAARALAVEMRGVRA